jgi:2,3,4,5-tetrahydropyridine-2-carboxylate N-succinyltransferase
MSDYQQVIEQAWDNRDSVSFSTSGAVREAVEAALAHLDSGTRRVAEKIDGAWVVNQWLKKAVLLSFRLNDNAIVDHGAAGAPNGTRRVFARAAFAWFQARWCGRVPTSRRVSC